MNFTQQNRDDKPVILIVCTGNSCRSQIAEGLIKDRLEDKVRVYSAGSQPAGVVHPMAIEVLREININIRRNKSRHWEELPVDDFDLIITVCDSANELCPLVPTEKGERKHIPFPDPIHVRGTRNEIKNAFRQTRDDIEERLLPEVENWLSNFKNRIKSD